MLLGEVNLIPEQLIDFFGGEDADEVNLLFNFNLMQAVWLALARQDGTPIARLEKTIAVSQDCQYANFLRNHDELTLDKLTDEERGVPGVRSRGGHAAVRSGAPAPAPVDARRRPGADPDGVQPAVLAAGHAGAVLR